MDHYSLGQLCLQRGLIDSDQLERCLAIQREGDNWRRLGEILLAQGHLTGTQLVHLLAYQTTQRREAPPPPDPVVEEPSGTELGWLLKEAVSYGAHALVLGPGLPPVFHICGRADRLQGPPIEEDQLVAILDESLPPELLDDVAQRGHAIATTDIEGFLGVRVTLYRFRNGMGAVLRPQVPLKRELGNLGLPAGLDQFAVQPSGLVVIAGPAGSGRASTLNSILHAVHTSRPCHIMTLERPVRTRFGQGGGLVTRCEIGRDAKDFSEGLRLALRTDADVIALSEFDGTEVVRMAAEAAGNGRLVVALMRTGSVQASLVRLLDAGLTKAALAGCLRGIVAQHLMPSADGHAAVPAAELLLCTSAIANLIREDRLDQIRGILQKGMTGLDQALLRLVRRGRIEHADALAHAIEPETIRRKLTAKAEASHADH